MQSDKVATTNPTFPMKFINNYFDCLARFTKNDKPWACIITVKTKRCQFICVVELTVKKISGDCVDFCGSEDKMSDQPCSTVVSTRLIKNKYKRGKQTKEFT